MTEIEKYYENYKLYKEKYGNIALLVEIGSFYELYGTEEYGADIHTIANIMNIIATAKNSKKPISKNNPYMCGFPNHRLEKFTDILLSHNYHIIVMNQVEISPGKFDRSNIEIISPSMNVKSSNYIMSVYIERYSVGISMFNVMTGKTILYETGHKKDQYLYLDTIIRFMHMYNPSEFLLHFDKKITETQQQEILNYTNITKDKIYYTNYYDKPDFFQIQYQMSFLKKLFPQCGSMNVLEYLGLQYYQLCVTSYILVLQYTYEHDTTFIQNLKIPKVYNENTHLDLMDHAIEQLQIVNQSSLKTESIYNLLNFCMTSLGKRKLKESLIQPITDINQLNERYNLIEYIQKNDVFYDLKMIIDIENYYRKLLTLKIEPFQLIKLYKSIKEIKNITNDQFVFTNDQLDSFITHFESVYDITGSKTFIEKHPFETNIENSMNELQEITNKYSKCLKKKNVELKIKYTDTNGYYIETTTLRSKEIKKSFPDIICDTRNSITKITSTRINQLSTELIGYKSQLKAIEKEKYIESLKSIIEKYDSNFFYECADYIANIDFYLSLAKSCKKYNYTRPIIQEKEYSYINAKDLRHPIVEQIVTENYVPNDVCLDKEGMLIFGTNGVGKSVYMKSIGISVILAQIGCFVPASEFIYSPFHSIITRITGYDNINKGHSTFYIEMLELRSILSRMNQHTLVISDEPCTGTEHTSGISLVGSAIVELHEKCNFVITTHLHKLSKIPMITELNKLKMVHLQVNYENGELVYNRKLKEGSGDAMYGLEIAKSLQFESRFLKRAESIRKELMEQNEYIIRPKKSKYNAKLYVSECEECGSINNLHTHHIQEQHTADSNGFIESMHKNHISNLKVLCEECHQKHHNL